MKNNNYIKKISFLYNFCCTERNNYKSFCSINSFFIIIAGKTSPTYSYQLLTHSNNQSIHTCISFGSRAYVLSSALFIIMLFFIIICIIVLIFARICFCSGHIKTNSFFQLPSFEHCLVCCVVCVFFVCALIKYIIK